MGTMVQTKCEVYSRVVGYIRPVQQWNDSKQAEFKDRSHFDSALGKGNNSQSKLKCWFFRKDKNLVGKLITKKLFH